MKINDWLRMPEAARYYYKQTGTRLPTRDTVRKWITIGREGYCGRRVHLKGELHKTGRCKVYLTRRVWMDEFIVKLHGPKSSIDAIILDEFAKETTGHTVYP